MNIPLRHGTIHFVDRYQYAENAVQGPIYI